MVVYTPVGEVVTLMCEYAPVVRCTNGGVYTSGLGCNFDFDVQICTSSEMHQWWCMQQWVRL